MATMINLILKTGRKSQTIQIMEVNKVYKYDHAYDLSVLPAIMAPAVPKNWSITRIFVLKSLVPDHKPIIH